MQRLCLEVQPLFYLQLFAYLAVNNIDMETLKRIPSIDILRGLVMIIMALDHTREFFYVEGMTSNPLDPATTTGVVYFTRWVTHFCAPVFVFLSGLSVYLSAQHKPTPAATVFLLKRGAWLIVVEVVVVSLGLTFNPLYNFIFLQVIWVIGWSIILLALLRRISNQLVLVLGVLLVAGHNALDYMHLPETGAGAVLMKVFFTAAGYIVPLSETRMLGVFYAILPWTGIMFLGYSIGAWYQKDYSAVKRKRSLMIAGVILLLMFTLLRWNNGYGDTALWKTYPQVWQTALSFLNVSKYPPSLLYFCVTIGPALIALALLENARSWISRVLSVYGSVPFFYYILHFYLLHTLLVIAFFATGRKSEEIVQIPFLFRPQLFGFSLPVVYLIWVFVFAVLYKPCLWFKTYKAQHSYWWLRYL
jgi:uncharacterized membrane protein